MFWFNVFSQNSAQFSKTAKDFLKFRLTEISKVYLFRCSPSGVSHYYHHPHHHRNIQDHSVGMRRIPPEPFLGLPGGTHFLVSYSDSNSIIFFPFIKQIMCFLAGMLQVCVYLKFESEHLCLMSQSLQNYICQTKSIIHNPKGMVIKGWCLVPALCNRKIVVR